MGIGNLYVEINYHGLNTDKLDFIEAGKEYQATTYDVKPGGSVVNFVLQAGLLGSKVGLIGRIGNDEEGDRLLKLLTQAGILTDFIIRSSKVQTCVNTGIMLKHSGQEIQLVAGNANQSLVLEDINLTDLQKDTVSAVYFGGYLKQESLYRDYPTLFRNLKMKGIQLFIDHGRIPVCLSKEKVEILHEALHYVEGYFPNEDELLGITSAISIDTALEKAQNMGPVFIAVKCGPDGCRINMGKTEIQVPGHSVNVISVIGAGDVFNAGFITQYLRGMDLRWCGEFANATAALYISENKFPSYQDVIDYMNETTRA